MISLSQRDRRRLLAFVIFVVTVVVYLPTFHNGYVDIDDPGYITDNPRMPQGLTLDNVRWSMTSVMLANWNPVTWLSLFLDAQLFGHNLTGFHATSIFLHAFSAVLLFLLLEAATAAPWRSVFVTALFALHPLNVETVSWLSERKSVLSLFFSLLMVAAYGWYVRGPSVRRYLAVIVAFLFALLSKPMAVSMPLLLLLLDYWPLQRAETLAPNLHWPGFRRLFLEKTPLFALSAAISAIAVYAQHHEGAMGPLGGLPLWVRLANVAISTVTYFRRLFWPSDLSFLYPHPGLSISISHAVMATVFVVLLVAIIWRFRSHRPLVVGFAFFAIALLPVSGIVQVGYQSMADRYAYVPFIGLFIALVWELADAADRLRIPHFARTVAVLLVLGALSVCTIETESYWRNSVTLFTQAHRVSKVPNLFIETNLASALVARGRDREAIPYLRIAESIDPNNFGSHFNLALVLARTGDLPAAIAELETALRCNPTDTNRVRALASLGNLYIAAGEPSKAVANFQQVLAVDPTNTEAKSRLAELQHK